MRRQAPIDPKTLRKHSQIVEAATAPIPVVGDREQTDYGFFVAGHKGKTFETKFLTIMPSCLTPIWSHPKKTRVIRVVAGAGIYQAFSVDAEGNNTISDQKMLTTGDEMAIEPGVIHRLTAGPNKLEFYVVQDVKYESSLVEVAPAETVAQVAPEDLEGVSAIDKENKMTMGFDRSLRRSRAQAQIEASRAGRANAPRGSKGQDFFQSSAASAGVNARPVTNFDTDGAG